MSSAILLISCTDRQGLVARVTEFIFRHNGNILHLDQHVDTQQDVFFMRVEWDLAHFDLSSADIAPAFALIADEFQMHWQLLFSDVPKRMAVFVSKQGHCLYDLLARWHTGEWQVEIPLIVSNHPHMAAIAAKFEVPYYEFQVHKANKSDVEQAQLALLREHNIDFVVLARYMQILTDTFVAALPQRIINIHHSFLPAFVGAKPYHQAYERGVKIIGATSHYVTASLDAGPIIEQDVVRISHKDSIGQMVRKGKDLEKTVLARAVWYHLHDRVLVYNNKTVVFD